MPLRTMLIYGFIAGLIVIVPMGLLMATMDPDNMAVNGSHLGGYAIMVVALSIIFLGVKQHRDRDRGGVIRFMPAFLVGLGISVVASLIYVIGWEVALAAMDYSFMETYTRAAIAAEEAKGVSGAELEAFRAQMNEMTAVYANPLFRMPITFVEIFPVGLIVSLITALLLRNPRFLPARARPAAG